MIFVNPTPFGRAAASMGKECVRSGNALLTIPLASYSDLEGAGVIIQHNARDRGPHTSVAL